MKIKDFGDEFGRQTRIAMVAAFGFLIALVWRDFISELVSHLTRNVLVSEIYLQNLITALVVTFVSVIGLMVLSRSQANSFKK